MEHLWHMLGDAGLVLGWAGVGLLCLGGLVLSCLSISGTWLVAMAAVGAVFLAKTGFPGWGTVITFILLSVAVEIAENFAATWGVARRGGSRLAGVMALLGGLAGMFAGLLVPIPLVGSFLGMLVGSFLCVFWVERRRLQKTAPAAHIARGAVLGRVLVLFLKVLATMAMMLWLLGGRFWLG